MTYQKVLFIALLTCLFLPQSVLAQKTPDIFMLNFCWPPEKPKWTLKMAPEGVDPHCLVEDLIITTYYKQLTSLPETISSYSLVNAPISGKTDKRGRHLLSFAAFNGFRRLAEWGLINGAYIDKGDKDNATMLRMAIGNSLVYMIGYALSKGANPNIQFGDYDLGPEKLDTPLTALVKWRGSLNSFEMVVNKGANLKDQEQYRQVTDWLYQLLQQSQNQNVRDRISDLVQKLGVRLPPHIIWVDKTAQKADLIDIDLVEAIDNALEQAIIDNKLTRETLDQFTVHGKNFGGFLAFNGFDGTLARHLKKMTSEQQREAVLKRDAEGNDLLLAAIKSKNVNAVKLALDVTTANVTAVVPSGQGFYSEGDTPMDVARKWQVSEAITQLLENAIAQPIL